MNYKFVKTKTNDGIRCEVLTDIGCISYKLSKDKNVIDTFVKEWEDTLNNSDDKLYLIINHYDTDGGFGDSIDQTENVGIIRGFLNAYAYCQKYTLSIITDEPYDSLTDGYLTFEELPGELDINQAPFHAENNEHSEYQHLVWNENRFIGGKND